MQLLAQGDRIGAGHGFAGSEDGAARGLFLCVDGPLDLYGGKAVRVGVSVGGKIVHVRLIPGDGLLIFRNLPREILVDLVLQFILLTEMAGFEQVEALHSHIQVHLLFDVGVAGTQGLDFRIGESGFVDVLSGSDRGFAGHDLADKLLLALHQLIEVTVKGVFGDIGVDLYLVVFITLSDDTALSLLEVGGTVE